MIATVLYLNSSSVTITLQKTENTKNLYNLGHMDILTGEWIKDISAGGSRNDLERFATNPQYVLTLTDAGNF